MAIPRATFLILISIAALGIRGLTQPVFTGTEIFRSQFAIRGSRFAIRGSRFAFRSS
jgi:hypothetical protein